MALNYRQRTVENENHPSVLIDFLSDWVHFANLGNTNSALVDDMVEGEEEGELIASRGNDHSFPNQKELLGSSQMNAETRNVLLCSSFADPAI